MTIGHVTATIARVRGAMRIGAAGAGLIAVLLALPSAAVADDGRVEVHKPLAGPKTAQDVREFWTPARMRKATPAEIEVERDPGEVKRASAAGGPAAAAAAVPQPDNVAYPNRVVGKVFYTQPGVGDFVCSASVINTDTAAFAFTAGHCVQDPDTGAPAENWMFVPGYKNGAAPFGEFVARELWRPSFPPGFSINFDHGAAILGPSASGQSVEDAVGALGIALFERPAQNWRAYGYPAEAPFDGEGLFSCDSRTVALDVELNPPPIGINCDMTAGSSGGPWLIRGNLVASNSSFVAPDELPGVLFGPQFNQDAADLFDRAHPGAACGGKQPFIVGTEGPDRLVGTKLRDVIIGDAGNDVIIGKGGKDRLCGEEGKDTLKGGKKKDLCDGGPGRDKARKCEKKKKRL